MSSSNWMWRSIFNTFGIICIAILQLAGQLDDNFGGGLVQDWEGDIQNFVVNSVDMLQLNAQEPGESFMYRSLNYSDSLIWSIDVELGFAPSNNNKLFLYLFLDSQDLAVANGYGLEIGENGSDDAINLIKLENGEEETIATGTMGLVSSSFALNIELTKAIDDLWTLTVTDLDAPVRMEEFIVSTDTPSLDVRGLFGLRCIYTTSNVDNFTFDNLLIQPLLPDTEPPALLSTQVTGSNDIKLFFDEPVSEDISNSAVTVDGQAVNAITVDPNRPAVVCVTTSSPLATGRVVIAQIRDIMDLDNNSIMPIDIEIIRYKEITSGDLLINEILFNPATGNSSDFIELINVSGEALLLDSILFCRANPPIDHDLIERSLIIPESGIAAFASDTTEVIDHYDPPLDAVIIEQSLPAYNAAEGIAWMAYISNGDTITIDSFAYTEDFHFDLIRSDQLKGISLERLSIDGLTNDPNSWFSAAENVNFATPGYENSQQLSSVPPNDNGVSFDKQLFTPNGDGIDDQMIMRYNLDKSGFIAKVSVYNDAGYFRQNLLNNSLLGQNGLLTWDGVFDGGQASTGMYIIVYEFFHPDGDVINGKEVIVLGESLD